MYLILDIRYSIPHSQDHDDHLHPWISIIHFPASCFDNTTVVIIQAIFQVYPSPSPQSVLVRLFTSADNLRSESHSGITITLNRANQDHPSPLLVKASHGLQDLLVISTPLTEWQMPRLEPSGSWL